MGQNTTRIPRSHPIAFQTSDAMAPPTISSRTAVAVIETGWWLANVWSQSGMVLTGTNAPEANTSGARTGNDAA